MKMNEFSLGGDDGGEGKIWRSKSDWDRVSIGDGNGFTDIGWESEIFMVRQSELDENFCVSCGEIRRGYPMKNLGRIGSIESVRWWHERRENDLGKENQ